MTICPNELLDEYNLSESEKKFLRSAETSLTKEISCASVVATFLLAKQIKQSTETMIQSNMLLSESQDKHSNRMTWLTVALVFVGLAPIVAEFMS